jgi:uncharacterized protein (TIGR04141 family)
LASKKRQQRITVFLVKEGIELAQVWDEDSVSEQNEVQAGALSGTLSIGHNKTKTPSWVPYLDDHVEGDGLKKLRNASTAAALLFEASGRLFIASFGYGRSMFHAEVCVPDFGLKVAVNTINPDKLKSVDARGYEELTLHTLRDVSRESSLSAFDIDTSKDVVRSITGSPGDESLAKRLSGADAVALNTKVQLPELPSLCKWLLDAYGSERYKSHFEFIDNFRRVTDKAEKAELDALLIEALKSWALDDLHMAIPQPIDWLAVEGVRFSSERKGTDLHTDPPVSAYLRSREGKELSLARLKADKVIAVGAETEQPIGQWSVYRCIVFEAKREDRLYVLSAGDWFWVNQTYADEVSEYVDKLPALELELPDCESGLREDEYNERAAASSGCLCLDGQFVTEAVPDKVEICDLLGPERQLIHVKKRGSSSTLSHLFNQGLNSAEWLFEDAAFRDEARKLAIDVDGVLGALLPEGQPDPADYEICFAVITRSERETPLTLPFFSLVSLRNVARRLKRLGFNVSTKTISEPKSS